MSCTSVRLGQPLGALRPTLHNGPGWRLDIWFQGCSLRCTRNCLSPHLLSSTGGSRVSMSDVLATIERVRARASTPVEGLTVLGGEPTDQPAALVELLEGAHELGLSTMVYTGHLAAALPRALGWLHARFLVATDVLVDGPFVPELYDAHLAWRGSSNQGLLCLSDRYSVEDLRRAFEAQGKGFSFAMDAQGVRSVSGLQARPAAARVERLLGRSSSGSGPEEEP